VALDQEHPQFGGIMTQDSDNTRGVEQLTADIQRFVDSEDVEFTQEQNEDLHELYEAVNDMARSAQRSEAKHRQSERYRQQLYEITTDTTLSDDDKIQRLLELGCERLGLENAHVVDIDELLGRHEIVAAAGSDVVKSGVVTDLSQTYCKDTINETDVLCVFNAPEEGYEDHPGYTEWGIEAYIAGKIEVNDELYGTVCFVSREPRPEPFTHAEKIFVDLLARWVSTLYERRLTRETVEGERDRFAALFENSSDAIAHVELADTVRICTVNTQFEEIFGAETEGVVGHRLCEITRPVDDQEWIDQFVRTVRRGEHSSQEVVLETATGEREFIARFVPVGDSDSATEGYAVYTDISDQKAREREIRETKRRLELALEGTNTGTWELDARTDPPELSVTDEACAIYEHPPDAQESLANAFDNVHPDDQGHLRSVVNRALTEGEEYDTEVRLRTPSNTEKWIRAIVVPVIEDGEVVRLRGSIQDITDQKERELALESLHETTRGLLGTETETDAAQLVVESRTDIIDAEGVALYLLDRKSNELSSAACGGTFCECGDRLPPVTAGGNSPLWNCFVTGEPITFENPDTTILSELFDSAVESGLVVPIGDHGVFVIATDEPAVDASTRQLVETLVATAEAAFDRIERDASLRERDAKLETQNEKLRRQIGITDIIRRIDRSLIGANSREEIERTVCTQLAEAQDIAFAWTGLMTTSEERLEPRAWAGTGETYLDTMSLSLDEANLEPAAITARTGEPTVVGNVLGDLQAGSWRKEALARDFHSVVSVPLSFEEYCYGVLTVYATDPDAFDTLERSVFAELGESIAHSINAVETRQALHAETLVELTLTLDPTEDFLGRVATDGDFETIFEGLATQSEDETRLFFSVDSADAGDVESALADLVSVQEYQLVTDTDDSTLFKITVSGQVLPSRLVRHGASPRSIRATADGMEVVVDVPTTTDVRTFVEMLGETTPSVELVARHSVKRTTDTRQELVSSLFEELTDRQQEVLRTAYLAGFFEWPRKSTGQDIAEMLDVSQPTVNRHLRLGQQRLFDQLF